jgi:hypothetical protein
VACLGRGMFGRGIFGVWHVGEWDDWAWHFLTLYVGNTLRANLDESCQIPAFNLAPRGEI